VKKLYAYTRPVVIKSRAWDTVLNTFKYSDIVTEVVIHLVDVDVPEVYVDEEWYFRYLDDASA
jgi:hypothetical protein